VLFVSVRRRVSILECCAPFVGSLLSFFLHDSVTFLDLADQGLATAGDLVQIVVGQLTPLLPGRALELRPFALGFDPSSCDYFSFGIVGIAGVTGGDRECSPDSKVWICSF